MKKLYSIDSFENSAHIRSKHLFSGDSISFSWNEMENGETQALFDNIEDAAAAFSKLTGEVSIDRNGKEISMRFVSYTLEESIVDDDDYDPDASVLDNIINGDIGKIILHRASVTIDENGDIGDIEYIEETVQ